MPRVAGTKGGVILEVLMEGEVEMVEGLMEAAMVREVNLVVEAMVEVVMEVVRV